MRNKISAVISCIAAILLLMLSVSAEEYSSVSKGIIAYELDKCGAEDVQEWIDTGLAENAGSTSEWYAIALSRIGSYNFSGYRTALENYVSDNTIRSATSRQKYALALLAVGSNLPYISETMENSIGEQGLMSYVYGLHLLNNGCTSVQHTTESVTEAILSMQLEDGGWAIIGENGDPDATAMTLQALSVQYKTNDTVKKSVDRALDFLSDKQLENGGYKSMGKETSESISQAIIALSALEIDTETDIRFCKNGNTLMESMGNFCLDDGSFCHEIGSGGNHTATVQAFMAIAAYNAMKEGKESLYVFRNDISEKENKVETIPETDVEDNNDASGKKSYKPVVCAVIVVAAAIIAVVLILTNRRSRKNYIVLLAVTASTLAAVLMTNISTPEDYYGVKPVRKEPAGSIILEIRCDTVAGKEEYIPDNGIILEQSKFSFEEGETVCDILMDACRSEGIQIECSGGAATYISGINYIYEYDFGDLSGWMYFVNGKESSVGCNSYILADGDEIKWIYSCEMGKDIK